MTPKLDRSRPAPLRRAGGFSIIEIIVTMAIIGILVLILVPVVASRTKTARLRAAEQDIENIAQAEERAGIDTGYYYRFYVLDDVGYKGDRIINWNIGPAYAIPDKIDSLDDEQYNTAYGVGGGVNFFISIDNEKLLPSASANTLYSRIILNSPTSESDFGWRGPYINWSHDANYNDWPDDPWGHDYLLFTRAGGMGPNETDFVPGGLGQPPSLRIRTGGYSNPDPNGFPANCLLFDRPTVLSLGPDGLPGDGLANPNGDGIFGEGDDIIRKW